MSKHISKQIQRFLTAVVSFAVLVAPFATGAAIADPACGIRREAWVTIPAPTFKTGPQRLTAYEVDAGSPARMLVTNGKAVMKTVDGTCTWKQVFALPPQPSPESQATAANSEILSMDIAEGKRDKVYLMIQETGPQGARAHVSKSDDFGETWTSGDIGLPVTGAPEELETPPTAPDTAYLAIDVGGGSIDLMFASIDGGQSWTLRSNPAALTPSMGVMGFEIDPLEANSLWAYGTNGMYHSTDGGMSFAPIDDFVGTPVNAADVFHSAGPAQVVGFRPTTRDALYSDDNGANWLAYPGPENSTRTTTSVAHGLVANDYFVTADGRVYWYFVEGDIWIDLDAPRANLVEISTDKAGGVYARSATTIEAFVGQPDDHLEEDDLLSIGVVNPGRDLQVGDPALTPASKKIVLDPGESRTVRYELSMPRTPLPLQVFFLLDTSDSMGPAIEDLANSVVDIINQLIQEDIRLKVGVGAFRAYPDHFPTRPSCDDATVVQNCEPNYVYRRIVDIGDPGPHVSDALETLDSDAGGFYKSHLGALWHLATGAGADLYPPGPTGHNVEPGLEANFHANGLRVVVHATDEAFGDDVERDSGGADFGNPEPPPIPEPGEVIEAFNAKDIEHIGLSIGTAAKKDLEEISEGTGTVAPAEGVNCGSGYHIHPGDPLVCPVKRTSFEDSYNLVPAIVNAVEALPKSTDIAFSVEGNQRVIGEITPTRTPDVVLQIANTLPVDVDYRCPLDLAGKRFDVQLDATRLDRGSMLDLATTQIVCRAIPKDPLPLPLFTQVFNLVAIAIPPPPPPVNVSAGSQAQSQAQAQTGAAFQEEEQPQVAIAAAYREAMEDAMEFEFEMVAYEGRKDPVSAYMTLGAGAALASFMYAGYMLSRQRAELAREQAYRRRR